MPRPNKPWFWKEKKAWYVNINGKRTRLGKNREDAMQEFHELMASQPDLSSASLLVVMDELLTWTEKNRSAGTFRFYLEHAEHFQDYLKGKKRVNIRCDQLTPALFENYLDTVSLGRRSGAVQMIKRVYNWGIKRGRIRVNPIMALEKPSAGRRKNIVSDAVFTKMLKASDQYLKDLLTFCWATGARPQEAWRLKVEHVEEQYQRCVLPQAKTKRKKGDRHIYCNKNAWQVAMRLKKNGSGYLFLTSKGTQWNKDNVSNRMDVLAEKIGKRYALYDLRHTWITKKVKAGMDTHLIAKLAGTSVLMIERYYDHSDEDAKFMLKAVMSVS